MSVGTVGPIGVSVSGAVFHNIGQLLCFSALMGIFVAQYLPLLLAAGAVAGAATGLVVAAIKPRLTRLEKLNAKCENVKVE